MAKKDFPTYEVLCQLLSYDEESGKLFWKFRPLSLFKTVRSYSTWNSRFAGKEALTASSYGYRVGNINYKVCHAHRVIWCMAYGGWPEHEVDHINGDRQDNRLKNLRAATSSENSYNKTIRKDNTSGYKGVYFCKIMKLWCARVNANKKTHKIGYYSTAEEAGEAYKEAARKLHGDFANLG